MPVPEGFVLMAPRRLGPILTTPILSVRGKLRMLMDLVLPRRVDDVGREPGGVRQAAARPRGARPAGPAAGRRDLHGRPQRAEPQGDAAAVPRDGARARQPDPRRRSAEARQARGRGPQGRRGRATACSPAWPTAWTRCRRPSPRALPAGVGPDRDRRSGGSRRPDPGGPGASSCSTARRSRPAAWSSTTEAHASARLLDGLDPELALQLRSIPYASSAIVTVAYSPRRGGPPARRLRRGRPGDRGAVDPGRLVPEREVPEPGPGRDGPDARLRRRGDPARAVRPRRRRDRGDRPRRAVEPARRPGEPLLLRGRPATPGRCRNTRSATSTGSRRSADGLARHSPADPGGQRLRRRRHPRRASAPARTPPTPCSRPWPTRRPSPRPERPPRGKPRGTRA